MSAATSKTVHFSLETLRKNYDSTSLTGAGSAPQGDGASSPLRHDGESHGGGDNLKGVGGTDHAQGHSGESRASHSSKKDERWRYAKLSRWLKVECLLVVRWGARVLYL